MNGIYLFFYGIATLILIHLAFVLIFNLLINPLEPSTFTKLFPYQFLYNLLFCPNRPKKAYFSLRVDINTNERNVRDNNHGVARLIRSANKHNLPITFSISSEFIPALSDEVKNLVNEPQHELISHSHSHSNITEENQYQQVKKSKTFLEKTFDKKIKGMVAPQAKHDKETLKAARDNGIEYISAGSLSYLQYWSFPYPFKKERMWLIGGSVPSDYYLYNQKEKSPKEALRVWKEAIKHRANKGWFTQLEYHNFSTSEEELEAIEQLFQFIASKDNIEQITQAEFLKKI